jgi:hypothetical protein
LALVVVVLADAGQGLGSVGFSFDAAPNSIYPADRVPTPRPVRPAAPMTTPAVRGIGEYADPLIRARSYFDAGTGQLCHGAGADRTCR